MTLLEHPTRNNDVKNLTRRRTGRISFIDIVPPIEEEIFDSKPQRKVFERFPLIPYSNGDKWTSHKLLKTLYNFKHMSPTFGGIVEDVKTYALKGKIQIVHSEDPIFDLGEAREATPGEKTAFVNELNKSFIFRPGNIKSLAMVLSECWDTVGMFGVEVITEKILGVTQITVKFHHPPEWMFVKNDFPGTEVALSQKWDDTYLTLNPPLVVPVYPTVYGYEDGTERTFFYKKNGGYLYGRPSDLSALNSKYSEYKIIQYLTKKNKKLFMPDVLIETEDSEHGGFIDDDQARAEGYESSADKLAIRFTNEGDDPLSIVATSRPYGAKPMFVHEFEGLKNAEQLEKYLQICEHQIIMANNWSKMLMTMEGASGFSEKVFMDTFAIKAVTKIFDRQSLIKGFINEIIEYGFNVLGKKNDLTPTFVSPLNKLYHEYIERNAGNTALDSNKGLGRQDTADM